MNIKNSLGMVCLAVIILLPNQSWSMRNSDSNYKIPIAVTINEKKDVIGNLEYTNNYSTPYSDRQLKISLHLVTFSLSGEEIVTYPYLFEIIEMEIIEKNLHRIKCRPLNNPYGFDMLFGSIDFRDEFKPKIRLVWESGATHISNISEEGKKMHDKYIPNIWLGN